jgi:16S rRNA (guanine527-N7)-methyltransferase
MGNAHQIAPPPPDAAEVLGERLDGMIRYAELLAEHGVARGLIGPREIDRLWPRHLLNSAVVAEQIPEGASVIDVGSGAGLPGVPLALARPDLRMTLLEPMARRVQWLEEIVAVLGVEVHVVRGRAEERAVRSNLSEADIVTARAVASLGRLADWCLPLLKTGGTLLALKGERAGEELAAQSDAIRRVGGVDAEVLLCGEGLVEVPTTVVAVRRGSPVRQRDRSRERRKDR